MNLLERIASKTKSVIDGLSAFADAGADGTLVSIDESTNRMNICKGCPNLGKMNKCGVCGCFMDIKTKLLYDPVESFKRKEKTLTTCPVGKW